jgi:predicted lipoprotein with Yx(FWY)xxD motif
MSRKSTLRSTHGSALVRLVAAVVVALFVAACGNSSSSGDTTSESSTQGASGAVLGVASTSLGDVLVDGQGLTVYMLTADSSKHSSCSSDCLEYWPVVAAPSSGAPSVSDISAALGVTKSTSGESMLTANGWPLYTFANDQAPGDVNGQGMQSFGGTWYVLSPAGEPIKSAPSSTDTGGGGGY